MSSFRVCKKCLKDLPITNFKLVNGYRPHSCLVCQSIYESGRRKYNRENYLLIRARHRAKRKGLEFSIGVEDIVIPKECPILKRPFELSGEYSPSLDRLDSSKGYTKDNIHVISTRANKLKWNSTYEEIKMLYEWAKSLKKVKA